MKDMEKIDLRVEKVKNKMKLNKNQACRKRSYKWRSI